MATTQKFEALEFNFEPDERLMNDKFISKVEKALAKDDATTASVAEQLDVPTHIVRKAADIAEHGRIPFRNQSELVKNIVKARQKENQSWGTICGRLGDMGGSRVRSLYESGSDEPYFEHNIGRGGRPRGTGSGDAKPKGKKGKKGGKSKKAASKSKKGSGKKKGGKRGKTAKVPEFGDKPNAATVGKALNGKSVTVARPGGKTEDVSVDEVTNVVQSKKTKKWGAKVTTTDGKERTFALDAVQAVA